MITSTILLALGLVGVFAALFVSLAAVGVFDNGARGVSKSLAVVEAFSAAPKELQDELEPSFKDRVLTPLLEKCLKLGKRLTPADYADRVRLKLDLAGNPPGWTADRVTALKVLALGGMLAFAALITVALRPGLGPALVIAPAAGLLGYYAPNILLSQMAAKRTKVIRRAFPDALDLLTISVEAGLGFDAALAHVAKNTEGPLAQEFARVLQEMQIGMGRSQALRALGERTNLEEMRGFVSAMVQADAFGIPIGQVLRVQSSEMRVKRRQRAEEQAQKLPVKILFPLIFFILPCLFIVILGPAAISIANTFMKM
jgi:tight adherence protein C